MTTLFRGRKGPLLWLLAAAALVALLAAACGGDDDSNTPTAAATTATGGSPAASSTAGTIAADVGKNDKADITGAGSTFAAPILQAWFDDYNKLVAKGVKVNYQSIGSGGGVQQYTEKTVDFGASDAPLSDAELAKAPDTLNLPFVLGSVVVTYNLDGVTKPLKFDGATVAKIYLGDIKKWNDPALTALNPGVRLPDKEIVPAYRSDGSGTSFVFTDWLSKVSPDWKSKVGTSKNPSWPAGQGGKGNEGVTTIVKQTPNSIGYVELTYALINKLPFADVKNKSGAFVTPSIETTAAAAAGVQLPADFRVSITDAEGAKAYPIASYVYALIRTSSDGCSKYRPVVNAFWWILHSKDASATASGLNYVPLPPETVAKLDPALKALKCEGQSALPQ
ncbi:MAG: phosphate ABC transporter substrate-binding protein PstS [Chloroflexi bacterium]|nr:phosphate ABC transporter substrate-binding protein PstS [Chloroflexota bacterium]